jgi:hypothetical protein
MLQPQIRRLILIARERHLHQRKRRTDARALFPFPNLDFWGSAASPDEMNGVRADIFQANSKRSAG